MDKTAGYGEDTEKDCDRPLRGNWQCNDDTGKTSILTGPEDPVYKPILEIVILFCSSLYQPAVHGRREGSSSQISSTRATLKRKGRKRAKLGVFMVR
jgi:hypothetical protein